VSKTEYNEQVGTVLCLAITGYNRGSVDKLIMQKVIAGTVHSVVGDVQSSTDVVTSVSHLLAKQSQCYDLAGKHVAICLWWMQTQTYLFLIHYNFILYYVFLRSLKCCATGGRTCICTFSNKW
jgi:hypothetical protein